MGPQESDVKEIRILNRVITWDARGIRYEADQSHVGLCLRQLGMEEASHKVSTPTDRSSKDPKKRGAMVKSEENEELLNSPSTIAYQATLARLKYLGQHWSEIHFAVKDLGRDMSAPTQHSWIKMNR